MINDKELEEAADTYTSEYDAKLARPELKPLHLGYREEKAKIKKHFIEGAKWAQGRCEEELKIATESLKYIAKCDLNCPSDCTCRRDTAIMALEKIGGKQ